MRDGKYAPPRRRRIANMYLQAAAIMTDAEIEKSVQQVLDAINMDRRSSLGDLLMPGIRGQIGIVGRSVEDVTKEYRRHADDRR